MDQDLSEVEPEVFPDTPDRVARFPAAGQQRIVAALKQDVAAGLHLLCITGPEGSGKTALLRDFRQSLGRSLVGMIEQPVQGRLLYDVAKSLQLGADENNEASLRRALVMLLSLAEQQHKPIIQIVDAADSLTTEDLNLLLHFFPRGYATLILAGRTEPGTLLSGCSTTAGDVHIDQCYHVDPFTAEETAAYIRHRLRAAALPEDLLGSATLAQIHQRSNGVPGLINQLCADALDSTGAQAGVSILPPTPTFTYGPEPVLAVYPDSRSPQAKVDELSAVEDTPAPEYEPQQAAVVPAQPVAAPQVMRQEPERLQRRMRRLQRSARIWRALAILAGVAFTVELTKDTWLDHMPAAFAALWNHAEPSSVTAEPVHSLPVPVHARAADSLTEPAAPPDDAAGHSDFAALYALAVPPEDAAFPLLPQSTASVSAVPESAQTPDRITARSKPVRGSQRMTRAQRQQIAQLYAERAEYEMRNGQAGAASLSIQRGLSTDPRNPRLLELRPKALEALRQP